VADIDTAEDLVHLIFYIWLPDNYGCKVVEALKRAAGRGVKCRAMPETFEALILALFSIIERDFRRTVRVCRRPYPQRAMQLQRVWVARNCRR